MVALFLQTFLVSLPLFLTIGAGWLCAKVKLLGSEVGAALAKFSFTVTIPCMLFQSMRRIGELPPPDWKIGIAFFGACFIVCIAAWTIGRKSFAMAGDESTVFSMGAIFSNNVQLGVPLAISLLGEDCIPAISLLISINVFVLWLVATIAVEVCRSCSPSYLRTCAEGLYRTVKNPVIAAILAGLCFSYFHILLPTAAESVLTGLAAAATPVALFSVGIGLAQYRIASHLSVTAAETFFKLAVMPLTVYLLCRGLELGRIETQAACLFGCLPVGVNVYIMSREFNVVKESTANALLASTALSSLTMPVFMASFGLL